MNSRLEIDNFTSAHLLCNHDNTRCLSSTSKSGNREQFEETSKEVAILCQSTLLHEEILIDNLSMDEVQVPCSLEWSIAKSE